MYGLVIGKSTELSLGTSVTEVVLTNYKRDIDVVTRMVLPEKVLLRVDSAVFISLRPLRTVKMFDQ